MQLLDDHLFMLFKDRKITKEVALSRADRPDQLSLKLGGA